jgi:tRNA (cytidine/uridine-2'-O-)-methyltransferase
MPSSFPIDLKKLKNSSLDYGAEIDFVKHQNFQYFLAFSKENDYKITLLTTKTYNVYYEHNFAKNTILLAGNESYGVPDEVRRNVDASITIPMLGNARSLNVATSVAIVTSEIIRQYKALG